MRQKAPRGKTSRGHKRVNSLDSHASSAGTYTTVSLSQSFMYEDDNKDDEVCSTVTTEVVKNLQSPFRSKRRTASNHEQEAYPYLLQMKPYNYIREDDDNDLSVGQMSYL
jgi:hypothetical protein